MSTMKNEDVIINLKLLKLCGFYQICDPTVTKIYKWNVYQLVFLILVLLSQLTFLCGNIGFFIEMEDSYNQFNYFFHFHTCIQVYLGLWKIWILYYNNNNIWELFNVTRLNFLWSKLNNNTKNILYKSRERNIKITYIYLIGALIAVVPWQIFPITTYLFTTVKDNVRFPNSMNFRFPVTVSTYNQYFPIFYMMECTIFAHFVHIIISTEVFFITFSYAIIGQYEAIEEIAKYIGHDDKLEADSNNENTTDYDALKTIIVCQQKLHSKIKLFLKSYVRPIILLYISFTSGAIIVTTYMLIMILTSKELFSIYTVFKVCSALLYSIALLYLYCYFVGSINEKNESMNFGIYSCNWTKINYKCRKLVLLAMRMNESNKLMIRATPRKMINLQLFANVMTTCYNIVSVMVKSMTQK